MEIPEYIRSALENQEFVKPTCDKGHRKKGEAGPPFGSPAQ
jgi:hypothetical protein